MNRKLLAACVAMVLPALSFAQYEPDYKCTYGELQRRVEIYREPGVSVPCEVHYYKDTEAPGVREVLWNASSDAGYCDEKVRDFVQKLKGWGWDCRPESQQDAASEALIEDPDDADRLPEITEDDTDTLLPAAPEETDEAQP